MDRLEREARAIAALNHPHICAIYDIGPDYLVMGICGGSACQRPPSPGQKVSNSARRSRRHSKTAHVPEELHTSGFGSRPIFWVTKSGVKLLDFGLARLTIPDDPDATASIAGIVMGTPGYMSPEQAMGQLADARSDIFSFGVVFYEMLSGRRPFPGDNGIAVMAAILHKKTRNRSTPIRIYRLSSLAASASLPLSAFNPATELLIAELSACEKPTGTLESNSTQSIAVLPFANISRDDDDEYFSDGLAEEIINCAHAAVARAQGDCSALRRLPSRAGMKTSARSAATLGVSNVLEGSVRRSANRLRITAQLIRAPKMAAHLWSQRYDRTN